MQRSMQISGNSFEEVLDGFRWQIPDRLNMGIACCDVHADATPHKTALIEWRPGSTPLSYSFGEFKQASNRLANALADLGFSEGERLGIILPQSFETAVCHIAVYKSAGIAVPLARLFAADALEYRIANGDDQYRTQIDCKEIDAAGCSQSNGAKKCPGGAINCKAEGVNIRTSTPPFLLDFAVAITRHRKQQCQIDKCNNENDPGLYQNAFLVGDQRNIENSPQMKVLCPCYVRIVPQNTNMGLISRNGRS